MSGRLVIPRDTFDRQIPRVFENVLAELPLTGCELVRNPLTGHLEYIAPEGLGFRMHGKFTMDTDQSDIAIWGPPQDSEALQAERHMPKYDEDGSVYYDVDDAGAIPMAEFIGRRLTVSVNGHYMGQPKAPGDGWESYYGRTDSDHDRPEAVIHVFGQTNAWYETGLNDYVWQKGDGVGAYDFGLFPVPNSILNWQTAESRTAFERLSLEIVPYDEPNPGIQFVSRSARDNELWDPISDRPGMTAEQDYRYCVGAGYDLPEWSPELRESWTREKREGGRPYSDDPLRDFWLLQGEQYVPEKLILDEVVAIAQEQARVPLGYFETQYQDAMNHSARLREAHQRRLVESLVVIEGRTALSQAVSQHASSDWLDLAMANYDSRPSYDWSEDHMPSKPISNCYNR